MRLIYSFWNLSILYILVDGCEKVMYKVDKFLKELFHQMIEDKNLCTNDHLKLYVSMKPSVKFTAGGFFDLGYPIITKVIAAAATYLVILIQFTLPNNKKHSQ
ncbi:hypothetical protein O3M35_008734 [Rhynocoris fuscipes]|uniref:Uncharacterized protein n=1 Tax=Rhynocoris fuscipes TaxID=488301 RepID=A0AAW1DCJ9_9HEMI